MYAIRLRLTRKSTRIQTKDRVKAVTRKSNNR